MQPEGSESVGAEGMPVMVVIKVFTVIEIPTSVTPPGVIVSVGRVAIRSVIAGRFGASSQANHRGKHCCQQDRFQFFHRSDAAGGIRNVGVKRRCLCNQAKRPPHPHPGCRSASFLGSRGPDRRVKRLFRAAFWSPSRSNHLVAPALVEMSSKCIDELAAIILQLRPISPIAHVAQCKETS
jgi:hypothetical protein